MASAAKVPYQRLKIEGGFALGNANDEDDVFFDRYRAILRSKLWYARLRRPIPIKRRFRLRVPALRRFLRRVRRTRLASAIRVSYAKVLKRLKESQSHFGDLFAGNYLFLQVNPTPVKNTVYCLEGRSSSSYSSSGHEGYRYGCGHKGSVGVGVGVGLHGLCSKSLSQ